jgi:hypothetical protein
VVDHDRPGGAKTEIRSSSFAVHGRKLVEFPREEVHAALKFEFNLPLPEGKRYGRGADICAAWDAAKGVAKGQSSKAASRKRKTIPNN